MKIVLNSELMQEEYVEYLPELKRWQGYLRQFEDPDSDEYSEGTRRQRRIQMGMPVPITLSEDHLKRMAETCCYKGKLEDLLTKTPEELKKSMTKTYFIREDEPRCGPLEVRDLGNNELVYGYRDNVTGVFHGKIYKKGQNPEDGPIGEFEDRPYD